MQAVIAGESLFASRRAANGSVCSYYGRIREDRARGFELCEGLPSRLIFALRFPPGGDRDALQRRELPQEQHRGDEWLDNPQTHDPNQASPGFNLEFRVGPRR